MVFDLVRKETLLHDTSSYKYKWQKYLMRAIKAIFIGLFIALECFIFLALNEKIDEYSSYGIFDFLILFLFIMFIVSIGNSLFVLRKLLFDKKDSSILLPLPISSGEIIFSKLFYLFFEQVLLNLCISTPLLICFGATRELVPYFYVFSLVYPLMMSLITISISLTFVVPFEYLYNFLKKYDIVQFVLASIVVILLCFAYQVVLNLFLDALNNNEGTGMLSESLVNLVHSTSIGLLPIYTFLDPICNNGVNLASGVCITFGMILLSLLICAFVSSFSYSYINSHNFELKITKVKNRNNLVISPFKALIKKEFSLLFKDSSYTFSYTSLLIMAPFLSFVVISSLNSIIYQNLRYFSVYFPDLVNGLNICLILLFSSVINASASQSITRENKALQIVKYIPVNPIKQVIAKVLMPIILSSVSLLITLIVLIATQNIDYKVFLISLFVGLILIVVTTVLGLYLDMYDKSEAEMELSFINNLISILFPIVILLIHFGVSLTRIDTMFIYIAEAVTASLLLIPIFIKPKKVWTKVFRKMEVE